MNNLSNLVQYRKARAKTGCPVTCWGDNPDPAKKIQKFRCAKPLAPNARLCAKHEADRIRLSR